MPTKSELEAEITLLKEMLEAEIVRADEWREIAERNSKAFLDFASLRNKEVVIRRSRELSNKTRVKIRNKAMREYFLTLWKEHENPHAYGVIGELRRKANQWAIDNGHFTNDKRETRDTLLSDDTLRDILKVPK
ncbi:MAG: hypothetical protein KJN89_04845 [Gammaproteobacteria bacterium]|nr:hypothetical protein [Gammaproteobacteria bacterium]MBT8132961.1 hypothetical protein [Gammaproteobacteria bacterium]NNJ49680.1 hypothetical protein [Gammaproteobacteria bacterium]